MDIPRFAWRAARLSIIAAACACSHDAVGPDSSVATVTIDPAAPAVTMGAQVPLTVTLQDAHGTVVTGPVVHWTSSDTTVATVSDVGVVSGVALGSAQIVASAEGTPGIATVTVTPVPVASVVVAPDEASSTIGSTLSLKAVTYDAEHHVLSGRAVVWSSSNEDVATVDGEGQVKAIAAGTATITATSEGKRGSASVSVSTPAPVVKPVRGVDVDPSSPTIRVGQTVQLHATLKDEDGKTLTDRSVAWTTSDANKATVSSTGLVRGVDDGTVTITATSEGKSGTAKVKITHRHVHDVTVDLDTHSLDVGETTHATATLVDSDGDVLTEPAVDWTSNNGAVATVSDAGVVQAVTAGSATIVATSDGQSGSASLTVHEPPAPSDTTATSSGTGSGDQGAGSGDKGDDDHKDHGKKDPGKKDHGKDHDHNHKGDHGHD
jgi:uncharacterized protein YjdB